MKKQTILLSFVLILFCCINMNGASTHKTPVIYSTDLFQPPEDPDDHYDLAMLMALDELDLKAIVFDLSTARRTTDEIGINALRQIEAIAGKPMPEWALGLRDPMRALDDRATNQPQEFQQGVELIIRTLRESEEKVVLFLVGSCRDFAVAYNREPELLKEKVKAVYVNAGNGPDGIQFEWNVMLDPYSYNCLMKSGLPIYWAPCFSHVNLRPATPDDVIAGNAFAYSTYYIVSNQAELMKNASSQLKNFFVYALHKSTEEPLPFLSQTALSIPATPRNMWCTGPFLHAAGREIYQHGDQYIACSPEKAKELGISDKLIHVYDFEAINIEQTDSAYAFPDYSSCFFMGCMFDKVGKEGLSPDGLPDCHIRITGITPGNSIREISITNEYGDKWQSPLASTSFAINYDVQGEQVECYFSPVKDGKHTFLIRYDDRSEKTYTCNIYKEPVGPVYKSQLNEPESNTKLFKYIHPEYNAIMVSVLSNLLKEL